MHGKIEARRTRCAQLLAQSLHAGCEESGRRRQLRSVSDQSQGARHRSCLDHVPTRRRGLARHDRGPIGQGLAASQPLSHQRTGRTRRPHEGFRLAAARRPQSGGAVDELGDHAVAPPSLAGGRWPRSVLSRCRSCSFAASRRKAGGAAPADAETYQTLRIEAGLPEYGIDIDENRLAMEVNRTAQAICYTKGCYLGQETIVMARDRGQVNRLLMGVKVPMRRGSWRRARNWSAATKKSARPPRRWCRRVSAWSRLAYLRRGSWDAGTELAVERTDGRSSFVRCRSGVIRKASCRKEQ